MDIFTYFRMADHPMALSGHSPMQVELMVPVAGKKAKPGNCHPHHWNYRFHHPAGYPAIAHLIP